MKSQYVNEIKGVIILAVALILLASLISFDPADLSWYTSNPNVPAHNLIRIFGAFLAGGLLLVIGYSAYFIALFLFFWSWNKFADREMQFSVSKLVSFGVIFIVLSSLFSLIGPQIESMRFARSGIVGIFVSNFLVKYFGLVGSYIILGALAVLTSIVIGEFLIYPFILKVVEATREFIDFLKEKREKKRKSQEESLASRLREKAKAQMVQAKKVFTKSKKQEDDEDEEEEDEEVSSAPRKPRIRIAKPQPSSSSDEADQEPRYVGEYNLPGLDLLKDAPAVSAQKQEDDLSGGAKILEETLAQFGVSVRVVDIEQGPVITRYELEPAPGVKVQRITALSDNISLAMKASSVRILAPIPGKNRVGIEVPNGSSSMVCLKEVLSQGNFTASKSRLTLALGKDTAGKAMVADLAEMPHLLVAGTTGSGKTVCLNSIILSMLYKYGPNEVKFLMVDPKMVELSQYNPIPHCLCPAVTNPKKVTAALHWVVGEMESRYSLLAKTGSRNIVDYHKKGNGMPYIVVVIDELADLMQICPKEVESAITRLAQLSRAVGIHLILATQRPSVDVITGVIKANFPARISFKVASKIDSRTVLDMNGAENLIGKGDMLFLKPGEAKPIRGQCCYVSDDEIAKVIDFIKVQQEPVYDDSIIAKQKISATGVSSQKDELHDEAVRLVIETNQASVSILQRRMRLGYTRAARLIDMMEQEGIVGPYCGSKPREILVNREEWLMKDMEENTESENG
ncbi:MAG: DNA translocase FtsK [Candidatus Aceula lacicola]|nr:DNA translocase FtsK [Candidatus Aceula lacicola]